jgi:hypothetical protein
MEPPEQNLYEMVKENNVLLHKINRREKVRNFFAIIKLALIVGLTVMSYIYIQPYLEKLMETYQTVSDGSQKMQDIGSNLKFDSAAFKDLFIQ